MPVCKVIYDRSIDSINASLKFETLLIAGYTIDLRKKNSNQSISPFPKTGDNLNEQDDVYNLPVSKLDGARLWVAAAIIDNTGTGGKYEVKVDIETNGHLLLSCTSGQKTLTSDLAQEIFIIQFEKRD